VPLRLLRALARALTVGGLLAQAGAALAAATVQIEELTWPELRERVGAGARTVLLPIGGTEQNGPHMALGKHNVRVRLLAARIAQQLGNALVAPVLAYVPEGAVSPPTQHMRWPGTITMPEPAFEALLAAAAESFRHGGFCQVVLLGDHGGYRASLDRVAAKLNKAWAADSACRVSALPEYYRASSQGHAQLLGKGGHGAAEIGIHAGLADTSLMLALDPSLVRSDLLGQAPQAGSGVTGNPARASAELGRPAVDLIIEASVAAIRALQSPKAK
jgi:creatinine amidohydrolase/Fe(II)-dependent formamide hydrolase-like protein